MPNGLNHSQLNASGSVPGTLPIRLRAPKVNQASTPSWKATRMYWTCLVVFMPRQETQTARAMKARQVRTLTGLLAASSARDALPVIWARKR